MADTVIENVVSKADFVAAQKEIAELRQRLEAAKEDKVKEQVTALEKSLSGRDDEIKNLKTEIENLKTSKAEALKSVETSKAEVEETKKKLVEAEKKLEENRTSVVKANRVSSLVDKGVDKAEAEKIVDTFLASSDEQFALIVDTHAKLVEANKAAAAAKDAATDDKKKKEKEKMAKAEQELEEAKPEETEASLSTEASDSEVDSVIAELSTFLSQEVEALKR